MTGHDHPGIAKGTTVALFRLAIDDRDVVPSLLAIPGGGKTDDAASDDDDSL